MINWTEVEKEERKGGRGREKRKDQERKLEALRWWWELSRVKLAYHHITRI